MLSTISNIATRSDLIKEIKTIYLTDETSLLLIANQIGKILSKVSPYQIITIIISTLGVAVNYLVVRTALLPYKNKIKLETSYNVQLLVGNTDKQILMFDLVVKNIGYSSVKLSQWGYTSDKKLMMQIINLKKDHYPIEIPPQDTYRFKIPMKILIDNIKQHLDNKNINDKILYFYVIDNLGRKHFLKFKEDIKFFLERENERCKNDNWDIGIY